MLTDGTDRGGECAGDGAVELFAVSSSVALDRVARWAGRHPVRTVADRDGGDTAPVVVVITDTVPGPLMTTSKVMELSTAELAT